METDSSTESTRKSSKGVQFLRFIFGQATSIDHIRSNKSNIHLANKIEIIAMRTIAFRPRIESKAVNCRAGSSHGNVMYEMCKKIGSH